MKRNLIYVFAGILLLASLFGMSQCDTGKHEQQAAATEAPAEAEEFKLRKIHILCYGDSNTWGYNSETDSRFPFEQRWPNILQEKLGDRYEVYADGMNGRATIFCNPGYEYTNGLDILPASLATHHPVDILIFVLGTNDCLFSGFYDINAETIGYGMEQLVLKVEEKAVEIQEFEPKMILVVPGALGEETEQSKKDLGFGDTERQYSHELAPLYKDIARRHHCGFIDGTDVLEVSPIDCVHLTAKGQETLADLVYEYISEEYSPSVQK